MRRSVVVGAALVVIAVTLLVVILGKTVEMRGNATRARVREAAQEDGRRCEAMGGFAIYDIDKTRLLRCER